MHVQGGTYCPMDTYCAHRTASPRGTAVGESSLAIWSRASDMRAAVARTCWLTASAASAACADTCPGRIGGAHGSVAAADSDASPELGRLPASAASAPGPRSPGSPSRLAAGPARSRTGMGVLGMHLRHAGAGSGS